MSHTLHPRASQGGMPGRDGAPWVGRPLPLLWGLPGASYRRAGRARVPCHGAASHPPGRVPATSPQVQPGSLSLGTEAAKLLPDRTALQVDSTRFNKKPT